MDKLFADKFHPKLVGAETTEVRGTYKIKIGDRFVYFQLGTFGQIPDDNSLWKVWAYRINGCGRKFESLFPEMISIAEMVEYLNYLRDQKETDGVEIFTQLVQNYRHHKIENFLTTNF